MNIIQQCPYVKYKLQRKNIVIKMEKESRVDFSTTRGSCSGSPDQLTRSRPGPAARQRRRNPTPLDSSELSGFGMMNRLAGGSLSDYRQPTLRNEEDRATSRYWTCREGSVAGAGDWLRPRRPARFEAPRQRSWRSRQ